MKKDVQKSSLSSDHTQKFNVLIVGMDGVSRLNFHRQLPKTVNLLKDLDAIELLGYNKVADNTFPNLFSLLTGIGVNNLQFKCSTLDDCPWIWSEYKKHGYVTGYGEDATELSIFQYKNHYLTKKPTDFQLIPFMKTIEKLSGHKNIFSSKICLGPVMSIEVLYDFVKKFASAVPSKHKFGFFWSTSLTHDDLNFASLADDIHVDFLKSLNSSSTLDNTILILLSDHGLRNDKIRQVYQGYLEDRLPYAFFLLPKKFTLLYPEAVKNLKNNTRKLTTAFDIYKTLQDLIYLNELKSTTLKNRSKQLEIMESKPIAISLFLPIHKTRTCTDAGIHTQWCSCHRSTVVSTKSLLVQKMSLILLLKVNSMLAAYVMCAKLSLAEIRSARMEHDLVINSPQQYIPKENAKYYTVTIRTIPGDALFEGLILHNVITNSCHVVGDVTRINMYGNQSACVYQNHIKSYCYCTC
ncbi:hypothetical protein L9F63_017322 [Diploptera punctata]|uniref:Uncharacterized protein n=1 Tax=Diploptera punctata TaxID=6984 RepID=A0AAD7ZZD2_DIPPU|nr:hypothetical protein L9F63_017322 [Diploptera punctata]